MPARFRLNFDEGIRVYVKPASTGLLSFILNLMSFLKSYLVTRPLGTLWNDCTARTIPKLSSI